MQILNKAYSKYWTRVPAMFRGSGVPDPVAASVIVRVPFATQLFCASRLDKTEETEEPQVSAHQPASRKLHCTH